MTTSILAIEDDPTVGKMLKQHLEFEGFAVDVAVNGAAGLAAASSQGYDLILLDLALPDINGFSVCSQLRERGIHTPVIIVSSHGETVDTVRGLDAGADDYVSKPYRPQELSARIRAVLRRGETKARPAIWKLGTLEVDTKRRIVRKEGEPLALTRTEFELLMALIHRGGDVVSRDELLDTVWGQVSVTDRTVDVHIAALRRKIEEGPTKPQYVVTVRGVGYRINDQLLSERSPGKS